MHLKVRSTSSEYIRSTFVDYFVNKHGHKYVKSSPVVPLCDSTVPFVNAGMNQFKGVFLGTVDAPSSRVVNSQKCVRVGGKHNDLDVVGTDGNHHTFFEMLGNWSFGDYYKKEACMMAWDLLLGPYRLKPENLVVTYFAGDVVLGLTEDRECRDIWKSIGVPESRLKALDTKDNFWEMGATGPCGPCTEIHYVNPDGSLMEIWNLVFIQFNREADGKIKALRRQHVDTGLGLERAAALLQGTPSNYDTDLFRPLLAAIAENSKGVAPYSGRYGKGATLDCMYRRLADHARMVSVCLADGVFPATSLNLKHIMRKCFKISSEVFQNPQLLSILYSRVAETLGSAYPELVAKEKEAILIIEHEAEAYKKMKDDLTKKWKGLVKKYPEVEEMSDVESAGFVLGYTELKEAASKNKFKTIPGELVFKLYDTYGFQEDLIERIACLNNLEIDKRGFWKFLSEHKRRHKTSFKEQASTRGLLFDQTIEKLIKMGLRSTNDQHKYDYESKGDQIRFQTLKTRLAAILNEDCEWIDCLEPCENRLYYLVTEDTNFYCEEGGQMSDSGVIRFNDKLSFNVDSVFKIRDFVFHKGSFRIDNNYENYINSRCDVSLVLDVEKRLNVMRNHTGVHLVNAAIRQVLPNSVVCPTGSGATSKGLYLNLSVYGEKLSQKVILDTQELIRESIKCDVPVSTHVTDSYGAANEAGLVTIPGETYPERGLRVVSITSPLTSKELCCGTHVPSTGFLEEFCITLVKGARSHSPTVHALTGDRAKLARELFCRAEKLEQVIHLAEPERSKEEISSIKMQLEALCGTAGAPYGEYAEALRRLERLHKAPCNANDVALQAIVQAEIACALRAAREDGRRFAVHFARGSYLMAGSTLRPALAAALAGAGTGTGTGSGAATGAGAAGAVAVPALLLGCAGGHIHAQCSVPPEMVTEKFSAEQWMRCVASVFEADVRVLEPQTHAEMADTKVSLITCEQLVQDAMRVAIKFAQAHTRHEPSLGYGGAPHPHSQNRQQN
ncbi:hypothetical protein ACJJTC_001130 [Scirpophaga incertulas]